MSPPSVSRFFNRKIVTRSRVSGQSIVEYAGMIVISTLMVGGMMGGAKQMMPVLFTLLSDRNAMALSDEPPMPAASFPSPAPADTVKHASEVTTGALLSPKVETVGSGSLLKLQISAPLALTQPTPTLPQNAPSGAGSVTVKSVEPRQATGPSPAPAPNVYNGPSQAPGLKMAPDPAPAPAPKVAPTLTPVPPP